MITYAGNGTLRGLPITDTGTAYASPGSNGSINIIGTGTISAKDGSGVSAYIFRAVGRYLADGKLYDIGVSFRSGSNPNPVGSLAFLSNAVVLNKDEYDRSGNGMTVNYIWKP